MSAYDCVYETDVSTQGTKGVTEGRHCVSKNDTDVADDNLNVHQPILVIIGRDVAERVCYRMVICYPTSPN